MVYERKKIMLAFGTRPEAIKMAPVYHALRSDTARFEVVCCVSAQHRQMLDQVLESFAIVPDVDLNVMTPGQDLYDVTSAVLLGMRRVLLEQRPDIVLVHGDTTTTMATALAAFYADVAVGHVEAGLRTWDLRAPFPEEFNRKLATIVTRWHFAPTTTSRENLIRDGVDPAAIVVTGNTVIDALQFMIARLDQDEVLRSAAEHRINEQVRFDWKSERFVLITGHRRENFGHGFLEICEALRELSLRYPDTHFVYPVHLNPNVRSPVNAILRDRTNIWLTEPLTYEPFIHLLRHAHLVLTDSGGIQEEAPSLGKPVLVMREVTERPEAVDAGTVRLVGAHRAQIIEETARLLDEPEAYAAMSRAHNPYGDGHAAARIKAALEQ